VGIAMQYAAQKALTAPESSVPIKTPEPVPQRRSKREGRTNGVNPITIQEVARLRGLRQSITTIARELGLPKSTVNYIVYQKLRAKNEQSQTNAA